MTQPHDDEYGEILRRVLRAEADELTPSAEGLDRIRTKIDERSARRLWWQMPWVRPAMAVAGALVVATGVMAGTPGIRATVIAAFNGQSNTPTSQTTTPYDPSTANGGYPTNGTADGTPSPTGSGSPSQGPAGGPCGPDDTSGGQVTAMHTPSSGATPSDCPTTPPPDTQTTKPATPTSPTPPDDHSTPPTHSTEPTPSDSPSTDPKPSDANPDPAASP